MRVALGPDDAQADMTWATNIAGFLDRANEAHVLRRLTIACGHLVKRRGYADAGTPGFGVALSLRQRRLAMRAGAEQRDAAPPRYFVRGNASTISDGDAQRAAHALQMIARFRIIGIGEMLEHDRDAAAVQFLK
ncbi:MAG TPA: hypothetical protein VNX29_07070 [Kaistia sp.]|nr:hypothetical protein [Kaistia sp.]